MPDNVFRRNFIKYLWSDMLQIAMSEVPGITYNHKFGRSEGLTTTEETIWDGGTLYAGWLTNACTISVVSDNELDDGNASTGTGAKTLWISGLDANWDEASTTITLDGDTGTGAKTTTEFLRVNRMQVITSGTSLTNVGTLTATADTDGNTMAIIQPNNGQTLMALWSVPRNKEMYISHASMGCGKSADVTFYLFAKPSTGSWNLKNTWQVYESHISEDFAPPLKFDEKTDVEMRGVVGAAGTEGSADFMMIIVDKEVAQ